MAPVDQPVAFCASSDLLEGGDAVPFEVRWRAEPCRAFAVRWRGRVHAYLNRCSHLPMEMDFQPNRFFDSSGQWLICATHGATYRPDTGACAAGPCRGPLTAIAVEEVDGTVFWRPSKDIQPEPTFDDL